MINNHVGMFYDAREIQFWILKQNEQIKDLVSLGIDVLIINPVESSSINETLKRS